MATKNTKEPEEHQELSSYASCSSVFFVANTPTQTNQQTLSKYDDTTVDFH